MTKKCADCKKDFSYERVKLRYGQNVSSIYYQRRGMSFGVVGVQTVKGKDFCGKCHDQAKEQEKQKEEK